MTVQETIQLLESHGWRECSREGDLRLFRHAEQNGVVTLSGQSALKVPRGAMKSLRRYALKEGG